MFRTETDKHIHAHMHTHTHRVFIVGTRRGKHKQDIIYIYMHTSLPLCVYAPLRLVRVSMATLLLHSNVSSYNGAFIHAYMLHASVCFAWILHKWVGMVGTVFCAAIRSKSCWKHPKKAPSYCWKHPKKAPSYSPSRRIDCWFAFPSLEYVRVYENACATHICMPLCLRPCLCTQRIFGLQYVYTCTHNFDKEKETETKVSTDTTEKD